MSIGGAISFGNEEEEKEDDIVLGISIDFGLNLPCFSMENCSEKVHFLNSFFSSKLYFTILQIFILFILFEYFFQFSINFFKILI